MNAHAVLSVMLTMMMLIFLGSPLVGAQTSPDYRLIEDPAGDVRDEFGGLVKGPGYLDLVEVTISSSGTTTTVDFELAEPLPTSLDVRPTYTLVLDTDGDGTGDAGVSILYHDGYDAATPPDWGAVAWDGILSQRSVQGVRISEDGLVLTTSLDKLYQISGTQAVAGVWALDVAESKQPAGDQAWYDLAGDTEIANDVIGTPLGGPWPPALPDALPLTAEAMAHSGNATVDIDVPRNELADYLRLNPDVAEVLVLNYGARSADFDACRDELVDPNGPFHTQPWTQDPFLLSACVRAFAALHAAAVLSHDPGLSGRLTDFVASTARTYLSDARPRYLAALQQWIDLVTA